MSWSIEEDTGSYAGTWHPHNGYYAGDFSSTAVATRQQLDTITRMRPPTLPSRSS